MIRTAVLSINDTYGVPCLFNLANIFGACPVDASPYIARDDVYKSEDPADHAEAGKEE